MSSWWQLCCRGGKLCGRGALACGCWTLWLGLALLLALQLFIIVGREMPVPGFLLRSLEQRVAASGLSLTFGRTTFAPTGRVLVENVKLSLPSLDDPIAEVRVVYMRLDPWALLDGRFEPDLIRASGLSLHIPAMLSESGAREDLIRDGDLTVIPRARSLNVPLLTARLQNLHIAAHGEIDLSRLPRPTADASPLALLLTRHYTDICRRITDRKPYLNGLRDGRLDLALQPSPQLGAIARATLSGSAYQYDGAQPIHVGPFLVETRLPLWHEEPFFARIAATTQSLRLADGIEATMLRTTLRARINRGPGEFKPRRAEIEIGRLTAQDVVATHLSAETELSRWPAVAFSSLATLGTEPLALRGTVNVQARSATLQATGRFDPELMRVVNRRTGHNVRQFLNFQTAPAFDLHLTAGSGGQPWSVSGAVAARGVYAYHVTFDRIGGQVRLADGKFTATDAYASIGENFATGSYTHDLATHDFRFLLNGQLRPMDINGWFHDWWHDFWRNFDVTAAAPVASVDVQGRWMHGDQTSVFVFADSAKPVINGAALDRMATLIYVRPGYYDAMQVRAHQGDGMAAGWFVRRHHADSHALQRMDFNFTSTLDPTTAAQLAGAEVSAVVAPFTFTTPVELVVAGHVGESQPGELAQQIDVRGQTQGNFTFRGFPLTGLNFTATVRNDDILIEPLSAGFAGGTGSGRMRIQGPADARTLGFDLSVSQAGLQQTTNILTDYFARRRNQPQTDADTYMKKNANVVMDLDVSAEGKLDDPLSFAGSGNVELDGRGLGEIRLLGLLSELLNFTALHFNHLSANFAVEKNKVVFPEVSVTGSNSAVSARGTYSLGRGELDFNARIYPFQESKFILKSVVGAVLTPLSNVLEVKLTGDLAKPKWAFVLGPTNLLRNLGKSGADADDASTPAVESPAPSSPPSTTPPPGPK